MWVEGEGSGAVCVSEGLLSLLLPSHTATPGRPCLFQCPPLTCRNRSVSLFLKLGAHLLHLGQGDHLRLVRHGLRMEEEEREQDEVEEEEEVFLQSVKRGGSSGQAQVGGWVRGKVKAEAMHNEKPLSRPFPPLYPLSYSTPPSSSHPPSLLSSRSRSAWRSPPWRC